MLIGVDWGGSSLRVFRFDNEGAVVERRASHRGVASIEGGRFAEAIGGLVSGWTSNGAARLIMCGMVGSRQGWAEAPYLACPTDLGMLAAKLLPLATPFGPALIAPGLSTDDDGRLDVMRGEETQFLGAMPSDDWSGVIVHPGTHAKWATFEAGRITGFRTWMTGELFAVLRQHSVLRLLMADGADDDAAFDLGVTRALADEAITSLLFTARTEGLFARLPPAALPSYLSGLLIGSEVAGGLNHFTPSSNILLVGDARLTRLYARAFERAGRSGIAAVDGDVAAPRGLWRLDQNHGGEGR
jgi:2-dehydro-3-deoxygalactonokinase